MSFLKDFTKDNSKPLYKQLSSYIQQQVSAGKITVGARLPTVKKLAKDSGISYCTVSKAIQRLVQSGTLNSRPGAGISVIGGNPLSIGNIGIIGTNSIPDMIHKSPFFGGIFNHLQNEVINHNCHIMYTRPAKGRGMVECVNSLHHLVGLFVLNTMDIPKSDLIQLATLPFPIFMVGEHEEIIGLSRTFTDSTTGTREAIIKMAQQGCKRIAFVADHQERFHLQLRYNGYCQGLAASGLSFDDSLIINANRALAGVELANLNKKYRPDALFIADELKYFPETLQIMKQNDLIPGENLFIGGFDDNYWQVLCKLNIPYISVNQNLQKLAYEAVSAIYEQINSFKQDVLVKISPEVVFNAPNASLFL